MKKDVKIIRDIDAIKMSVESTRSKILSLLRVNDMTISQLAEALNKDQSTIYRHIKKLEGSGFVEVCGERKIHHIPEKKYGRTANIFLLSPRDLDSDESANIAMKWEREHAERIMDLIEIIGYETNEEMLVDNLTDFFTKLNNIIEDKLEGLDTDMGEIDYPRLLRLKLLLFLLEIAKDDDLNEMKDQIVSKIER
ncbi:MAG: winged helix-turn-helix domain-containing protein [Thermoplasmata archaeon]